MRFFDDYCSIKKKHIYISLLMMQFHTFAIHFKLAHTQYILKLSGQFLNLNFYDIFFTENPSITHYWNNGFRNTINFHFLNSLFTNKGFKNPLNQYKPYYIPVLNS